MTFSLAQSPSNVFVFSVLHFITYALLDITRNWLTSSTFFFSKKALRNYFLSRPIVCTQQGAAPKLQHQIQPTLIAATWATSTCEWCFPRDAISPEPSTMRKEILLSPSFSCLSSSSNCAAPPGSRRGESSVPQASLGSSSSPGRWRCFITCSFSQDSWLVKSSSLGSACPRQQRGSLARCLWNAFPTAV